MKKTQKWITENFERLVEDYGGKYIAVAGEAVIAAALTPRDAMKAATQVAEEGEISLLKVPRKEELVCIL
jgi:GTP cyclohydrolase III